MHQARDEVLGRDVAVKVFHIGSIEPDDEARQRAEGRILAGLSHRNLVTVFDIGTDTVDLCRRAFLVMELITGEDLHRANHHSPLTGDETKAMGRGVAEALAYIHSQGVIHRDVKPGNILIGAGGDPHRTDNPKLTDFGIARLVEEAHLTVTGQSVGTAAYFSPEQAEGLGATTASDIYSLGLVLLECLTGEAPFPGPAAASAAARLYRDPVVPAPPDTDWGRLLRDMTHRDPAARPSAEDVSTALASASMTAGRTAAFVKDLDSKSGACNSPAAARTAEFGEDGVPTSHLAAYATAVSQPHTDQRAHTLLRQDQRPTTAQQPLQSWGGAKLHSPGEDDGVRDRDDEWLGNANSALPASLQRRRRPGVLQWTFIALAAALAILIAGVILVPALMSGAGSETVNYPPASGELGTLLEELQESTNP